MISSMTGYGRCEVLDNGRKVVVEISSVNHRYLDLNVKMPKLLMYLDDEIKQMIKKQVARGKTEVSVMYQSNAKEDLQVTINEALASAYIEGLRKLGSQCEVQDDLKLSDLLQLSDVVTVEKKAGDEEALSRLVKQAVLGALTQHAAMRQKEGMHLASDLLEKNNQLKGLVSEIEELSPQVVTSYKERLENRLSELLQAAPVDEGRMATEIALFADKCAIDEEITRLKSHMSQLEDILGEGGVVGRKLDFLMQEMNREANTIGSKANHYEITKRVVSLKTEIEKIREQVQNIE